MSKFMSSFTWACLRESVGELRRLGGTRECDGVAAIQVTLFVSQFYPPLLSYLTAHLYTKAQVLMPNPRRTCIAW